MNGGIGGPWIAALRPVNPSRGKLAALLLAVLGCACGDATGERFDTATDAIVNGSVDNGDPAVVALTTQGFAFCSGTLIRPDVVATAAHCLPPNLADFGVSNYNQIDVFFGSQVGNGGEYVPAVAGWTHPGWNIDVFENDIGLLRLSQAGPATPIPFATQTMTNADVGQPTRLVGFGITQNGGQDSGRKRQGNTTVEQVYQYVFTMGLAPSGTCSGDSGGPTLMMRNGQEMLAGIHSRSDCVSEAVDTRVDDYATDINNFIGEDPAQPMCSADGQCASGCGAVDPDCPCAADGFCVGECADPATDPDCAPSCSGDGFCDPECGEEDPDCVVVEPPVSDGWTAGDASNESYKGEVLSSCAMANGRGSHDRAAWMFVAALSLAAAQRRRRAASPRA